MPSGDGSLLQISRLRDHRVADQRRACRSATPTMSSCPRVETTLRRSRHRRRSRRPPSPPDRGSHQQRRAGGRIVTASAWRRLSGRHDNAPTARPSPFRLVRRSRRADDRATVQRTERCSASSWPATASWVATCPSTSAACAARMDSDADSCCRVAEPSADLAPSTSTCCAGTASVAATALGVCRLQLRRRARRAPADACSAVAAKARTVSTAGSHRRPEEPLDSRASVLDRARTFARSAACASYEESGRASLPARRRRSSAQPRRAGR